MMGMMGGGAPAEGPVEGAPVEKEGGGDKQPKTISFDETEMEGGDMGEVKQDASGIFVIIPNEDGLGDFPANTKVIIPEAMVEKVGAKVGGLLSGGNYTATLNANGEYELTSNEAEDMWGGEGKASQENELERQPAENADEID